jgi:nucleotide-binding universal stress UspA family protein
MTGRPDVPVAGAPVARAVEDDGPHRVVVGVDGTAGSRAALVYAWLTAATQGADLEVVATYTVDALWLDPYVYDPTVADSLRSHTEDMVGRLVDDVRRDPAVAASGSAAVALRSVVVAGPAAPELIVRSEDADLLVVGSRGRGGVRSAMLGSVALHCVTHARCPVVVVHPTPIAPTTPARVVVGVDGSDRSRAALAQALVEASRRGAEVEAVAAYEPADHWTDMSSALLPSSEGIRTTVEQRARAFVADVLAQRSAVGHPTPAVHVRTHEGAAHDVLVSRARGAALLIVGSTGRGELRSLLLGSVALHCAMHAPCPVMVVHPRLDRRARASERPKPAAVG